MLIEFILLLAIGIVFLVIGWLIFGVSFLVGLGFMILAGIRYNR